MRAASAGAGLAEAELEGEKPRRASGSCLVNADHKPNLNWYRSRGRHSCKGKKLDVHH